MGNGYGCKAAAGFFFTALAVSVWGAVPVGVETRFDGSVRTISPKIDAALFWGAVTRDKGEVLADW